MFEIAWAFIEWGTGVKTNAKGGADADVQLGEKQWMWRHLRPERATTSFQMRHSQGRRRRPICNRVRKWRHNFRDHEYGSRETWGVYQRRVSD
jgi:hypothetical protein